MKTFSSQLCYCTLHFLPITALTSSFFSIASLPSFRLSSSCHPPWLSQPPASAPPPTHCLICRGYIMFVLLLLGLTPPTHTHIHTLSANPTSLLAEVRRRSGESWDYPAHLPGDTACASPTRSEPACVRRASCVFLHALACRFWPLNY